MANKFKFDMEKINVEFAGKFTAFYELKKEIVKTRSDKTCIEREVGKIDIEIGALAEAEYPDMAKLKALELKKAPLVEKVSTLSDKLKEQNKALKEHVEGIIPPGMYLSYVHGVQNSDFDAFTKDIKSFTVQVGLIAKELGGHNITDAACRRFANEVKTHIGSKTTSGKEFLEGKLVKAVSQKQFNVTMVQVILEVLATKYKVFSFDEAKRLYIVNSNN